MDPIRRIERPRQGIDPVYAASLLPRVERDEEREQAEPRERKQPPRRPAPPPDDGRPHVDVHA